MKKALWMMVAWLTTVGGSVWANDSTIWHEGEIALANGREWKGELNFNWKADVIQCRQGTTIKAYSANQINAFAYFDEQQNTIRKFVSMNCPTKSGFQRMHFLEEMLVGPLPVYRELYPGPNLIKSIALSDYNVDEVPTHDIDNFTYLVVSNDELIPLDQFYRKIWPHLKSAFEKEIKKYASLIQADMTGTLGRLRLINRYNYLVGQLLSQSISGQNTVFSSN